MIFGFKSDKNSLKPLTLPINYEKAHYTVRRQAREQYAKEQEGKCCNAVLWQYLGE